MNIDIQIEKITQPLPHWGVLIGKEISYRSLSKPDADRFAELLTAQPDLRVPVSTDDIVYMFARNQLVTKAERIADTQVPNRNHQSWTILFLKTMDELARKAELIQ